MLGLLLDDLRVLPLVVLLELRVRHELVHETLLLVLLRRPVRVVIHRIVDHPTDLKKIKKNTSF